MIVDYKILFIILIHLCKDYADSCYINLDNWNILQQYNATTSRDFAYFHDGNENEVVKTHIPRHRDPKTKKAW